MANKVKRCMRKGCKIYAFEAINEDINFPAALHPIIQEFKDVIPKDFPGMSLV